MGEGNAPKSRRRIEFHVKTERRTMSMKQPGQKIIKEREGVVNSDREVGHVDDRPFGQRVRSRGTQILNLHNAYAKKMRKGKDEEA